MARTATPAPAAASAAVTEEEVREVLTPEQQLRDLENAALERGMPLRRLGEIQARGGCKAQIQERIELLNAWLAAH